MIFDRYAKLKKAIPDSRVYAGKDAILPLLRGSLEKKDLPVLVVEPANRNELVRVIEFAMDKDLRISVASGATPAEVRDLDGHILILMSRFCGAVEFSKSFGAARVDAGLPVEALIVQMAQKGKRWRPLQPAPTGESIGSLYAKGFEGLRNFRDGGTVEHVRAVEWLGYNGTMHGSGSAYATDSAPDVSNLLLGSLGKFGIITSLELSLAASVHDSTMCLIEFSSPVEACEFIQSLKSVETLPESVVYWGVTATEILRRANDGTVSDEARVLVSAEWDSLVEADFGGLPATIARDEKDVSKLWQDLFRLPKAASRLAPHRTTAKFKLPVSVIPDLEARAAEYGRENNIETAIWGTGDGGHVEVWILQQDGEARSARIAQDMMSRLKMLETKSGESELEKKLLERCDPQARFSALK